MKNTEKNIEICDRCGQKRPYPKEPGAKEYLEEPGMVAIGAIPERWLKVTVRRASEEGFLEIVPIGKKDPIWWPNNAQWRKAVL